LCSVSIIPPSCPCKMTGFLPSTFKVN
jgi:hypothetical protein